MRHFIGVWNRTSLIKRIIMGVILGLILGVSFPKLSGIGILGDLFVGGLKAVAPLLVFVLVANALSQHDKRLICQQLSAFTLLEHWLQR